MGIASPDVPHKDEMEKSRLVSSEDQQFWQAMSGLAAKITDALNKHGKKDIVARAITLLQNRILQSTTTLWLLCCEARHPWDADGALILRAIYDASLQSLYILNKPELREQRARQYLDFAWIEKDWSRKWGDKYSSPLAKNFRESPMRSLGEPVLDKNLRRIRSRYLTIAGKEWRQTWYKGSLRNLAEELGLEEEYDLLQKQLSGAVHSSPHTLLHGPVIRGTHHITWAWHFAFRLLARVVQWYGLGSEEIGLRDDEWRTLQSSDQSLIIQSPAHKKHKKRESGGHP